MEIDNTRSIHNDPDIVAMSYAAGRWPIQPNGITPGDVNNGVHPLEVTFNPVPVELCEPVAFVYSIVNGGNTDVSGSVMAAMQKGGEDYLNDRIKSLVNPDSNAVVTGLTILQTIGGSLLGAGAGVLLDAWLNLMSGLLFADCDGTVASESFAFQKARDLQSLIRSQGSDGKYSPAPATQKNPDAPSGCRHSVYKVSWSALEMRLPLPSDDKGT